MSSKGLANAGSIGGAFAPSSAGNGVSTSESSASEGKGYSASDSASPSSESSSTGSEIAAPDTVSVSTSYSMQSYGGYESSQSNAGASNEVVHVSFNSLSNERNEGERPLYNFKETVREESTLKGERDQIQYAIDETLRIREDRLKQTPFSMPTYEMLPFQYRNIKDEHKQYLTEHQQSSKALDAVFQSERTAIRDMGETAKDHFKGSGRRLNFGHTSHQKDKEIDRSR